MATMYTYIYIYMSWVMKSWAALHRSYFSHSCHWRRNPARMSQLEMSIEVTATSHYSTLYVWHKFRYYNHMLNHIYIYIHCFKWLIHTLYIYIYIYIFIWYIYIYNHIYIYIYICIHIMHWYIYIYISYTVAVQFQQKAPCLVLVASALQIWAGQWASTGLTPMGTSPRQSFGGMLRSQWAKSMAVFVLTVTYEYLWYTYDILMIPVRSCVLMSGV